MFSVSLCAVGARYISDTGERLPTSSQTLERAVVQILNDSSIYSPSAAAFRCMRQCGRQSPPIAVSGQSPSSSAFLKQIQWYTCSIHFYRLLALRGPTFNECLWPTNVTVGTDELANPVLSLFLFPMKSDGASTGFSYIRFHRRFHVHRERVAIDVCFLSTRVQEKKAACASLHRSSLLHSMRYSTFVNDFDAGFNSFAPLYRAFRQSVLRSCYWPGRRSVALQFYALDRFRRATLRLHEFFMLC